MVSGTVADDGSVRCGCGKKVGCVNDTGVEFWCPSCKVPVQVEFARMKAQGLLSAIGGINAAIAANAASMAAMQALATKLTELQA